MILELVPAYGRTYKTTNEMEQDWNDGKDFKIRGGGPYCSIRDIHLMKGEYTLIRLYPNMLHEYYLTKVVK
jgi:hypothetical protein